MGRVDGETLQQIRLIGSLEQGIVSPLGEALSRGAIILDLAEVDRADDSAVRFLAGLPADRCALVACPRWLAQWIERARVEGTEHS